MASSAFTRGPDNLKNGIVLGGLFGLGIYFGSNIMNFLITTIPENWKILGAFSIPVYLILLGMLIGYIIDYR